MVAVPFGLFTIPTNSHDAERVARIELHHTSYQTCSNPSRVNWNKANPNLQRKGNYIIQDIHKDNKCIYKEASCRQ